MGSLGVARNHRDVNIPSVPGITREYTWIPVSGITVMSVFLGFLGRPPKDVNIPGVPGVTARWSY